MMARLVDIQLCVSGPWLREKLLRQRVLELETEPDWLTAMPDEQRHKFRRSIMAFAALWVKWDGMTPGAALERSLKAHEPAAPEETANQRLHREGRESW